MSDMTISASRRSILLALAIAVALVIASVRTATADTINLSTFVSSSAISAVEGQNNTIAFNYAGNEFVGSVYSGANNLQLYSTNLSGGNVQKFGSPVPQSPNFNGEPVLGASLGLGGFPTGNIYAAAGNTIYHYANSGGVPTAFATVPGGGETVRQIFFDPGSSFGGNMIVTTSAGNIYTITSSGTVHLVASVGEDTEGMDIATSASGPYAGDLLVASENSGHLRLISPTGTVTDLDQPSLGNITVAEAETISFVPLNLNASDPLQGFYVANYPIDVQFASASQFVSQGLLGDAIVTQEFGSNSGIYYIGYNSVTGMFTETLFSQTGNQLNQSEDGIFVSAQREGDITPPAVAVPEPSSLALMAVGLGALGWRLLRRKRASGSLSSETWRGARPRTMKRE